MKFMHIPVVGVLLCLTLNVSAQHKTGSLQQERLKRMSLEERMNIEVISVSKRREKLVEAASAIQVVTSEEIHNFTGANIPEELYLAGNLR